MELENPYRPGAGRVPEYLAGRDAEIRGVTRLLAAAAERGTSDESPTIFIGPRGHGKTALLRHLAREAAPLGYAVAWSSCARDRVHLPAVVQSVGRALRDVEADGLSRRRRGPRATMDTVSLEVGVPGLVKGSATASLHPDGTGDPALSVQDLADLLQDAAAAVTGRGGAGLVLCLDELDRLDRASGSVLVNALQVVSGSPRSPVVVVGGGLPRTPRVLGAAGTFSERFTYRRLPRLDQAAEAVALTEPAAHLGVAWTAAALRRVHDVAAGYPYFIQLLAKSTWDVAAPVRGSCLTEEHVRGGEGEMEHQLEIFFAGRWESVTDEERSFLTAMAEVGGETVLRADLARQLGVHSRALSRARSQLLDKGMIEDVGRGQLAFAFPGFADHLREGMA